MSVIRMVDVTDLYTQCSLRVRNFGMSGMAMSDCCQQPATTAVQTPANGYLYRCREHAGLISVQYGPVVQNVPMQVDCPEELDG